MEFEDPKRGQVPPQRCHKKYVRAQIVLRILTTLATLIATLVMGLNKDSLDFGGGFRIGATYKTSPAFEFFVVGNALVCGYSFISLVSLVFITMLESYTLPLLDLVSLGLSMASASAATAIGYLGKKGNAEIGWSSVCPYLHKFCQTVGVSLAFSFIGFLLILLTCSHTSAYKTKLITNA